MDKDIQAFADGIGAADLRSLPEFRKIFKRSNYFFLSGNIIVVKISRSDKPFWGVKRAIIEKLSDFESVEYYIVLLTSPTEGFLFNRHEVNSFIRSGKWNLAADDSYKINWPLPDRNGFSTPEQAKLRIEGQ